MKGAIFNIDNLIVDTDQQQLQAWRELAMYEYGLGLPGKIASQLKGLSPKEALSVILNQLHQTADKEQTQELLSEQDQMYQKALDTLDESALLHGINRLLINLDDHYVDMAVNDIDGHAELILKQLKIDDYFKLIARPSGDNPYTELAKKLDAATSDCIALVAKPADVEAINEAHMISIGVGNAELLNAADYQVTQTGDLRYPMLRKVWEDKHTNK